MRTLIEPSLGAPDREHEISAPGGAYSPVLCQPPILESISTVRLTVWAPFSGTPGKSFAAGHAFSEASLASFHSRHFSRSACMRPASFPFSTERNPWGIPPYPPFFRLVPGPCFQRLVFFRLDIIPARNRINGKLRHPVFTGWGKRPSGSGSSSTGISSSCLRASSSRSRRSSSSLLLFPVLRVRPAPEAYGPLPPPAAPSLPALPHKPSGPPAVPFPSSP